MTASIHRASFLAGSAVTNTGPTTVQGDLGVSPGTAVTGFPPGAVSAGTIHSADAGAASAQSAATSATGGTTAIACSRPEAVETASPRSGCCCSQR
jgi:Ice-binding-like